MGTSDTDEQTDTHPESDATPSESGFALEAWKQDTEMSDDQFTAACEWAGDSTSGRREILGVLDLVERPVNAAELGALTTYGMSYVYGCDGLFEYGLVDRAKLTVDTAPPYQTTVFEITDRGRAVAQVLRDNGQADWLSLDCIEYDNDALTEVLTADFDELEDTHYHDDWGGFNQHTIRDGELVVGSGESEVEESESDEEQANADLDPEESNVDPGSDDGVTDDPESETEIQDHTQEQLEQSIAPYGCGICGERFDSELTARKHITQSTDSAHRGRSGTEPGVVDADDAGLFDQLQVPSDGSFAGSMSTKVNIDKLFRNTNKFAGSNKPVVMSNSESDTKESTADTPIETTTTQIGNRSYTGPAIDGTDQYIGERPVKESTTDNEDDAERRRNELYEDARLSDYPEPQEKQHRDIVFVRLLLAYGQSVKQIGDEYGVTKQAVYQQLSKYDVDTRATRHKSISDIYREEQLPVPDRVLEAHGIDPEEYEQPIPIRERPDDYDSDPESELEDDTESEPEPEPKTKTVEPPSKLSGDQQLVVTDDDIFSILSSDAPEATRRRIFDQVLKSDTN